jgi:hypothetical protein
MIFLMKIFSKYINQFSFVMQGKFQFEIIELLFSNVCLKLHVRIHVNDRWSVVTPVPGLGNADTPVNHHILFNSIDLRTYIY